MESSAFTGAKSSRRQLVERFLTVLTDMEMNQS
jgi:hypothetical protein